jgi:enoyl-CoA hydratase/carnithine racemase
MAHILVKEDGDTVRITMNRPARRNSLSYEHLAELLAAFEEAGRSAATGIVLAGEGPVFSAGHDFGDVSARDLSGVRELLQLCTTLMKTIQAVPQVVIARVHGLATAAGCQLVASCDLAVAAESAGFALPGGKGGWFCHTPLVAVARAIGARRALELGLTGDSIDARTALAWGLVNRVVPRAELVAATEALARAASRGSLSSKATGKRAFYRQIDLDTEAAYAEAVEVMAQSAMTADGREAMRSFVEKRPAKFSPTRGTGPTGANGPKE